MHGRNHFSRLRFELGAEHLCRLDERAVAEALIEIAGRIGGTPAIFQVFSEYYRFGSRNGSSGRWRSLSSSPERGAEMTALSATERERLARILGMLGSDHAGERMRQGLRRTVWFGRPGCYGIRCSRATV